MLTLFCCRLLLSTRFAEPVKATATATASASGTNANAAASANATAHADSGHTAGHDAGKPVTEASKGEPKKTETAVKPKEEPKPSPTNQGRFVYIPVLVCWLGGSQELTYNQPPVAAAALLLLAEASSGSSASQPG